MFPEPKIKIEYASEVDRELWDTFVENNAFSAPYHLWGFGETFSLTYGYKRYYLIARDENNNTIGVFPLIFIKSRLFGSKLISLPFCEYGGPLSSNIKNSKTMIMAFIDEILNIASKLNIDYLEIRNSILNGEWFEDRGFKIIKKYLTFQINLSVDKKRLWGSLDRKTRNAIRKAMKANIDIFDFTIDDKNNLKKYFLLYLQIEKKLGSPPHSFKLFTNLLATKKSIKLLMAEYKGEPAGGVIVFYNKKGIYWWNGVSNSKFKNLNVTNLLLWKIIEWGNENGFSFLNLGRTRKGTGVYHFKKGLGGEEIFYTDYVYPLPNKKVVSLDPTKGIYKYLTKFWSHLPLFISRSLGPRIIKQIGL